MGLPIETTDGASLENISEADICEKNLTEELYGSFGQGTPDEMDFDKNLYWERFYDNIYDNI